MQILVTVLVSVLLVGASGFVMATPQPPWARGLALAVLGTVMGGGVLSVVRDYQIVGGTLVVRRLLWQTRIPLRGLVEVRAGASLTAGSLRLMGNGGFFSSTGQYWNRSLGRYRLLANDASRAVLLRFADRRVVVAPQEPERLVQEIRAWLARET